MNILFLIENFPGIGGIESVTSILAKYFSSKDIDVSILSYHGSHLIDCNEDFFDSKKIFFFPHPFEQYHSDNIEYAKVVLDRGNYDYVIFQDSYHGVEQLFSLIDYPWEDKLIVVEHNSPLYSLASIKFGANIFRNFGIKTIKNIIFYPPLYIKIYFDLRKRHLFLMQKCKRYVVLSSTFFDEIKYLVGRNYEEKLVSIVNPLTLEPCSSYSTEKKKEILFVGRLTSQKGCMLLVNIWKKLSIQFPDWKLRVVGDGLFKEKMQQFANRNNTPNIIFEGFQTNVEPYYRDASLLFLTSIFEGFALVLNEAKSRGCVPIAFNSFSSVCESVTDGYDGVLVHPFNISEFINKASHLMTDNLKLSCMRENAYKSNETFNVEVIGRIWEKLFLDCK